MGIVAFGPDIRWQLSAIMRTSMREDEESRKFVKIIPSTAKQIEIVRATLRQENMRTFK